MTNRAGTPVADLQAVASCRQLTTIYVDGTQVCCPPELGPSEVDFALILFLAQLFTIAHAIQTVLSRATLLWSGVEH